MSSKEVSRPESPQRFFLNAPKQKDGECYVLNWDYMELDAYCVSLLRERDRLLAERDLWKERHDRERAAHAKNLTEQQKCEAERLRWQESATSAQDLLDSACNERDRLRAALEHLARAAEPGIDQSDDELEQFIASVKRIATQALFVPWNGLSAKKQAQFIAQASGAADETPALLTDWEKARDIVASIVRQTSGDMRLGALHCLHAVGDAMRGTPASPVETSENPAFIPGQRPCPICSRLDPHTHE